MKHIALYHTPRLDNNKEVFVKHEKTLFWTFWPNSAISGDRNWPKLSKGTSTNQDLSYEPIPMYR